jgi:hypothetical protein
MWGVESVCPLRCSSVVLQGTFTSVLVLFSVMILVPRVCPKQQSAINSID